MIFIFAFLFLSYSAGNNKFPHKFWFVPVLTVIIGLAVLFHAYLTDKIKKENDGKNNR
jgi:hypothetical protein